MRDEDGSVAKTNQFWGQIIRLNTRLCRIKNQSASSNYSLIRLASQPFVRVWPIHSIVYVPLMVSPLILPW